MERFAAQFAPEDIEDLYRRLALTRYSIPTPGPAWAAGTPPKYLSELVDYWRNEFDWDASLGRLNSYPQLRGAVGAVDMHMVYRRSLQEDAPAIVLLHGWPYTFAEMLALADELADFHVVVPSLPGFGFSTIRGEYRCDRDSMGDTIHDLMTAHLGHERYFTYGEDLGAPISDYLAATYPDNVLGIHATHAAFAEVSESELTAPEKEFMAWLNESWKGEDSYARMQSTKPDTIAAALSDSPAGLAAWLVEKFRAWSDCDGDLESRFSKDQLLTTITMFWLTNTIGTSMWSYFDGGNEEPLGRIDVPATVAVQRHESAYPREMAERAYADLRSFRHMSSGGHFAAAEEPAAVANEIRNLARIVGH